MSKTMYGHLWDGQPKRTVDWSTSDGQPQRLLATHLVPLSWASNGADVGDGWPSIHQGSTCSFTGHSSGKVHVLNPISRARAVQVGGRRRCLRVTVLPLCLPASGWRWLGCCGSVHFTECQFRNSSFYIPLTTKYLPGKYMANYVILLGNYQW